MNLIFLLSSLFILTKIRSQLIDYCSNSNIMHDNENECLRIIGCCYAVIGLNEEYEESIEINNCFKRFQEKTDATCTEYAKTTLEYGNKVVSCKCNEESL
jgi:hypothetical protein